jgi:orotidine-5'-phosphate decarboxylase
MLNDYKKKVIVALDFNNIKDAAALIDKLEGEVYIYKVGLELFLNCGNEILLFLKKSGYKIFLDLKFYDIPNTVYNAVKSAGLLGADIINVHASGGIEMMKAAKKGLSEAQETAGKKIELFAVTVLTSFSSEDIKEVFDFHGNSAHSGQTENTAESIALHLAGLAEKSGLDGVVCSPLESLGIKKMFGEDFKTITPGIRLKENNVKKQNALEKEDSVKNRNDDQRRIMTPSEAFRNKADYIVVGRPITHAAEPLASLKNIYMDIQTGFC